MKINLYDHFANAFPDRQFDEKIFDSASLAFINAFRVAGGDLERVVDDWIASSQPCTFASYARRKGLLEVMVYDGSIFLDRQADIIPGIVARINNWREIYRAGKTVGFFLCFTGLRFTPMPRTVEAANFIKTLAESIFEVRAAMDKPVFFEVSSSLHGRDITESLPVNFFCAQESGSDWRNRHFPGGIAFSVNSGEQLARLVSKDAGHCPIQLSKFYESNTRQTLNNADHCEVVDSRENEIKFVCNYDPDVMLPSGWFRPGEKNDRAERTIKSAYRFS